MYSKEVSLATTLYPATVYINKLEITANIPNEFRYTALTPDLRIYLTEKYKWNNTIIDNIDWEIHSKALSQQHPTMRKTITQFIHRWLPTHSHPGTKHDITTKCPICHVIDETNNHFLTCSNIETQQEWQSQIQSFYDEMEALDMEPILLHYMILAIDKWRTISVPEAPEFCHYNYHQLYKEQSAIGWNQVIYGRLTKNMGRYTKRIF
jgi:hypothetical protein